MYMKVMRADGRIIVAVCDKELLGQVFEEGDRILDLESNRGFYEGELCGRDVVKRELARADSINLVGERAVGVAKEAGLVEEGNIIKIAGIPHAQAYRMSI